MSGRRRAVSGNADRQVRLAWEQFVAGADAAEGVRPEILLSWQRSRDRYRVDPGRERAPLAADGEAELDPALAAELGALAARILPDVEALGGIVAVGDPNGRLIAAWGDRAALRRSRDQNLGPWAAWTERDIGTTGVSTALEVGGVATVCGPEHWCETFHDWSCAAVAVREPATGRRVGVLDVSAWRRALPVEVTRWLRAAARRVEEGPRRRPVPSSSSPCEAARPPERLVGVRGRRSLLLRPAAVRVVEAEGPIVWLETEEGRLRAAARSLAELERRLSPLGFVRVSRSALVNLAHVREVAPSRVRGALLLGVAGRPEALPVARRRAAAVRRALGL